MTLALMSGCKARGRAVTHDTGSDVRLQSEGKGASRGMHECRVLKTVGQGLQKIVRGCRGCTPSPVANWVAIHTAHAANCIVSCACHALCTLRRALNACTVGIPQTLISVAPLVHRPNSQNFVGIS